MTTAKSAFVSDLTWDVVRDRLVAGAPVILPIGAGSKQHGFHLPLGTDAIQADWFARQVAQRSGGLIWPCVNYGFYPAFSAYHGSVSLMRETFEALLVDVIDTLLVQSRFAVIVVDTGISTIAPVRAAIANCSQAQRVLYMPIYQGKNFSDVRATLVQQRHGSHADEIETSILLAMAPDVVDMSRAQASPQSGGRPTSGPLTPDDKSSPDYSPSGSYGDPSLASREKGEQLIAAMLRDIDDALRTLS
ncbi:MAG: hypothetical protein CTY31_03765 [Hyphomicrobium sp.]|nr:MAG: hypothetical protein CTY39_10665 [Hyphomicrobium sp.]PPD01855.1 MAG: hypothetical protein CTY31_03765 [Hyphomicrobium sp.]